MCKCTPNIRTPFCGKSDCQWPEQMSNSNNINDGKILTPEEAKQFVDSTYACVETLIHSRLAELHKKQQWILKGRIINFMFASFYGPQFEASKEWLDKSENRMNGNVPKEIGE